MKVKINPLIEDKMYIHVGSGSIASGAEWYQTYLEEIGTYIDNEGIEHEVFGFDDFDLLEELKDKKDQEQKDKND